jgi:hypothetical protein
VLKDNGSEEGIPVTGREGPQGCEMFRMPYCIDNQLTDGSKAVSLTSRQRFTQNDLLVLTSVRDKINPRFIVRMEGLGKWKMR